MYEGTCMKYAFIPARSLSALLFYHIILFHSAFTRKKSGAEVLIVSSEDFLPGDFSQIIFSGFSQVIFSEDFSQEFFQEFFSGDFLSVGFFVS
jgi:hypothetical protein